MHSSILFFAVFHIVFSAYAQPSAELLHQQWNRYKLTYHKHYDNVPEVERVRFGVFSQNYLTIYNHNLRFARGLSSFSLGLNQFSDQLASEVSTTRNGLKKNATIDDNNVGAVVVSFMAADNLVAPPMWDWRDHGAVTEVKDQGNCGSCYAFSATGAIEGQHFRATQTLVSLSEQNVLDCTQQYGNMGCNGGWMEKSFDYVRTNGGIDTETAYPYEERVAGACLYVSQNSGATVRGFVKVRVGDEKQLMEAVASMGPVSVSIDASHQSFHMYADGVYYEPACVPGSSDHAVLVVGYGTDAKSGMDYWLVKNSWGTTWGLDGYIKMARNRDNNCCIACNPLYPLV